jgi:hypothetical protein
MVLQNGQYFLGLSHDLSLLTSVEDGGGLGGRLVFTLILA